MKNKKELLSIAIKRSLIVMIIICMMASLFGINSIEANAYDKAVYNPSTFSAVFDANYYLARYPELASSCGNDVNLLFEHFLFTGMAEGRQAKESFNVLVYMRENEDLRNAFGADITSYYYHYLGRGMREGRVAYDKNETKTYYDYFNGYFDTYFKDTVFIGDSIMLGYRNFCARQKGTYMPNIKFLCAGSYSVNNALKPVAENSLHPIYKGEKVSVWDGVNKMGAKHVYIMFGTNDLAITGVDGTVSNYIKMIDNIKSLSPDADINIISMTYTVADYKGKGLNNTNIKAFNQKLETLCNENGYKYINLADEIDDGNGNLLAPYCSDGFVHLNFSCYANAWKPVFEKAALDNVYNELFTDGE